MRVKQPVGTKGSLKWMQSLAACPAVAEREIRAALHLPREVSFKWCSPREDDERAEYRDGAFLDRIELGHLRPALKEFWPRGGPQWDGLARVSDGKVLLFEAKAHVNELGSVCKASPGSRAKIDRGLSQAREKYGARADADWATGYYQYANRLAHLYFLRKHEVDAHLVFLYFLNDAEMNGPRSRDEWATALHGVHKHLGLDGGAIDGVHSVYIDVSELTAGAPGS
jgi:hypothetical protein